MSIKTFLKSIYDAFTKEPENNVLDVGIPADPNGEDQSTESTESENVSEDTTTGTQP